MKTVKRYLPHFTVFLSAMGIMIVELVASRIISKYFGNSLYTWTGVIGVVLGGISLGNYIGGKLSDRYDPEKLISVLLLVSSFLVFLILLLDMMLEHSVFAAGIGGINAALIFRSVTLMVILFFLPATSLGMISPAMAKLALLKSDVIGGTVGSIWAVSSAGSIVGTFLSGYLLIPFFGVRTIIFSVALVIAVLSFIGKWKKIVPMIYIPVIVLVFFLFIHPAETPLPENTVLLFQDDTPYSHVRVLDKVNDDKAKERVLIMDGLVHNRHQPGDPDTLLYDYEKIFRSLTAEFAEGSGDLRVLTIGGGAMTFPDYLRRHYNPRVNQVVEIDGDVVEIAREYFNINSEKMEIIISDGRGFIRSLPEGTEYDIIYLDAFNSFSIPAHLTTADFLVETEAHLNTSGIILSNTIDVFGIGHFLNAYLQTVEAVFPNRAVYVPMDFRRDSRTTFVIAAASEPVSFPDTLRDRYGSVTAYRLEEGLLSELKEREGEMVLRDDYAPVESLMGPVFLASVGK
ncbi:MAG: fused MFS/spermidine synthase [Spirochaetia bacterium]